MAGVSQGIRKVLLLYDAEGSPIGFIMNGSAYTYVKNLQGDIIKILDSTGTMKSHNIPCEMIVYDTHPLENAYGKPLAFLGIDIAHEMSESLLEGKAESLPKSLLNEHLLCAQACDVPQVIKLCDHGGALWLPCWVYHVL